ncbi:MAG: hypothetical protein IPK55_11530 [Streptococcus sp.]|nr:hypothetical protein [Streptococcus sp.]
MHQNETQVFRQTQNVFYHSDAKEVPYRTDLRAFFHHQNGSSIVKETLISTFETQIFNSSSNNFKEK